MRDFYSIAQPVAALLLWTMVMYFWMYATRIPAILKAGYDIRTMRGTTAGDLDKSLPPEVQWKAHNYNHLLEQPMLFYAACFLLLAVRETDELALALAWTYVALRIVHSLVQATVNVIILRFPLFLLASIALLGLILRTARAVFSGS